MINSQSTGAPNPEPAKRPRPPGPPGPPVQGTQGLQFGGVIDDAGNVLFTDAVAKLIAQAGAGWVRINFRLNGFQDWAETTTFGYSATSLYEQVVANALQNNLQVLGLLSNEAWHGNRADWQANNAEVDGGNGDNDYLRAFSTDAAVVLAEHFAGQIDLWEVWNEPNVSVTFLYPSNFAWLLRHVYEDVKAAGVANARFVSGGLSSRDEGAITASSTGADYLRDSYAQGIALAGWEDTKATYGSYPLDAIGQHIYIDPFGRTSRTRVGSALQLVRDAYVAGESGTTTKETLVTEVGWGTNNVSERTQASNLQAAYNEFEDTAYVRTAHWFFLRDEPPANLYFGLLRPDSSEKRSWDAYQKHATY
jgi:hypothetical protein